MELKNNTIMDCGCKVFADGSRIMCTMHARQGLIDTWANGTPNREVEPR